MGSRHGESKDAGQPAGVKPRWSVRSSLAWLLLACLIPGVAGALILFGYQYRDGRARLETDTLQTARALVQAVDSHLLTARAVGETLATDESLATGDFKRFQERAWAALERTKVGVNIVLYDREARQIVNLRHQPGQNLPYSSIPEVIHQVFASRQPAISDLIIAPLIKRPVLAVYVPVMLQGKVAYVLGVGILAEHLNSILRNQSFPPDWLAAIFDSTGTIVARSHAPEQFVGRKVNADYIEGMRQSPEGSMETISREGVPILSIHSRSSLANWTVGIGIPLLALKAELNRTLITLALGVAGLFGIGLYLAWFVGERIARSVRALTDPVLEPGAGASGPPRKFHIKEAAEVAALLQERTAALREANESLQIRERELLEAQRLDHETRLALHESQARFQAIFEQAAVGIARVGLDGHWQEVNDKLCSIVGYERRELLRGRYQDITYPPDLEADQVFAQRLLSGPIPNYTLEKRYIRKGGSLVWVNLTASLVRKPNGDPDYFIAVAVKIQRRKEAEAALEAARQSHLQRLEQQVAERTAALQEAHHHLEERVVERTEQVRRLAAEVTYAEERERQALARDLHDDLGQLLHVVGIKLGLLARKNLMAEDQALVEETAAHIADASRQVRSLTSQLSPPVLSTLGLPAALRWLSGEIQQLYGLPVSCQADVSDCGLSAAQAAILFRAARELLINVSKHARSRTATVELKRQDNVLTLAVEDSGIGFPAALEQALAGTSGFGLASVRERISFLGGTMEIQPIAAGGVRISLFLPLETEINNVEVVE